MVALGDIGDPRALEELRKVVESDASEADAAKEAVLRIEKKTESLYY